MELIGDVKEESINHSGDAQRLLGHFEKPQQI
jgi:hypothetical protein